MNDWILSRKEGAVGLIQLNRPKALNALTLDMIRQLRERLLAWREDPTICAVIIESLDPRVFSAGGDIRSLYEAGRAADPRLKGFFREEYAVNQLIYEYPKPYISLLNGLTMGGGAGISLHGSYAIATEQFQFAMPETAIGFFPDVGVSYLLARCPDHYGSYLALSGKRVNAPESKALGLIKAHMPSEQLPIFRKALLAFSAADWQAGRLDALLARFEDPSAQMPLDQALIRRCFDQDRVEAIYQALEAEGSEAALAIRQHLQRLSPTSLKVSLEQIRRAKHLNMEQCLGMDYTLAQHFMRAEDFYEGVRALILDKDKNPQWRPASLEALTKAQVAAYFEE